MIVYITGTSSGIGFATANQFLKEGYEVIGMSRHCKITHQSYKHIYLDLSDLKAVEQFDFDTILDKNVLLINNAGVIKPIKPIGHLLDKEIVNITRVNLLSPQILMNKFIHKYNSFNHKYTILNISSGAGKYPIDAWASYCASKAGIDLFSETINLEFKNRQMKNWRIFSFAPGVVDTNMQTDIRNSNKNEFKSLQKFIDLKQNNELISGDKVALTIFNIVSNPNDYPNVVFSIRDL